MVAIGYMVTSSQIAKIQKMEKIYVTLKSYISCLNEK